MARKLDPERREKFLETALNLFAKNGVQHTTTAAIAAEAGAAAGTLFLYFPTKQDLIHSLVLRISRQQSEYLYSLLQSSLSVKDTFFTIWSGSIRWFLENQNAYRYVQQIRDSGMIDPAVEIGRAHV